MVEREVCVERARTRIVARANFSLSGNGLLAGLGVLAALSLTIAGLLAWQGYWPILAVALVQLAVVSVLLVRAWQTAWVQECIEFSDGRISVVRQRHDREQVYGLDGHWARVWLQQPRHPWYAPRVLLRSCGRELELGGFLNVEDRARLAEFLQDAVTRHGAWQEPTV